MLTQEKKVTTDYFQRLIRHGHTFHEGLFFRVNFPRVGMGVGSKN
jgi:hypothetical protein